MQTDIHPTYHSEAAIVCACGNTMKTGSTMPEIHIELCNKCHPFYTGKQKLVDTAGRVEKFKSRTAAKDTIGESRVGKKVKRERNAAKKEQEVAQQ